MTSNQISAVSGYSIVMKNSKANFYIVLMVALTVAIFTVGLFMPLGIAAAVPYVFVVLITLWIPNVNYTYMAGTVSTLLTMIGMFLAPETIVSWDVVIANRIISVIGIWAAVVVVLRQKELEIEQAKSKELLEQMNITLEEKVNQRTQELTAAFKDLETSKQEIQLALRKEKELHELKSRFVTMASHEFRTPLAAVLSSSSLAEQHIKNGQDEKVKKHLIRIRASVRELETILEDFLSLEKLEFGKIKIERTNFNLPELCDEMIEDSRSLQKEEQCIKKRHSGNLIINEDSKAIKHIIQNLLSNACKYSGNNSSIALETNVLSDSIVIMVSDNGMGIPSEDQKNMFTKFFRAKNAIAIQGTGIGLNIVKQYVELLKGNISFSSAENEGTAFTITLPLHPLK